jgi:NADH dehydrogenase FAD-containing subunit
MRLLLIGAGHTHLYLLRHAGRLHAAGIDVTLVAPPIFRYSGAVTAVATGALPVDAGRIDVAAVAQSASVRHVIGVVRELDAGARRAVTDDGTELDFDVVSLNVGSTTNTHGLRTGDEVVAVKPVAVLEGMAGRLASAEAVTIVGAGASGLELAGQLALDGTRRVTVIDQAMPPGGGMPVRPWVWARGLLEHRGVTFLMGEGVRHLDAGTIATTAGRVLRHDLAILATGLRAHPVVAQWGVGDDRGVPVRASLQHPDHDHVHAVGDCAHFLPRPLPYLGVYGVRQGPVLLASLLSRARGERLPVYTPQRRALQIVDLGGQQGVAMRGRVWWHGRTAWRLKRWIDERWLAAHRPG